jgi:hypothetical protein
MASILDLPPELILAILSYLGKHDQPSWQDPSVDKRPRLASAEAMDCPCFGDTSKTEQLLTCAGRHFNDQAEKVQRDVVRFGTSHPYFMGCLTESGLCQVVDAWSFNSGLVWPSTPTIPFAVRQVQSV